MRHHLASPFLALTPTLGVGDLDHDAHSQVAPAGRGLRAERPVSSDRMTVTRSAVTTGSGSTTLTVTAADRSVPAGRAPRSVPARIGASPHPNPSAGPVSGKQNPVIGSNNVIQGSRAGHVPNR